MLPRIFELFAQADHSLDRSKGGLGIGLTLVQKLVEMHGGQIGAHSDGLGKGSTFTIELPLAPPPTDAGPRESLAGTSKGTSCRVLLVDDNADAAHALALVLQAAGHTVVTAHEGQAAIQQAIHSKPHAILLDIGLPYMDGYEVARRIRSRFEFGETLLIAISGYGQVEDRQLSIEAGFDHHFVKPVKHDELLALLAQRPACQD
jgi:two-component system, chemotaxis family, CheB/CheR fusion protein